LNTRSHSIEAVIEGLDAKRKVRDSGDGMLSPFHRFHLSWRVESQLPRQFPQRLSCQLDPVQYGGQSAGQHVVLFILRTPNDTGTRIIPGSDLSPRPHALDSPAAQTFPGRCPRSSNLFRARSGGVCTRPLGTLEAARQ
jgi:hypothetical protein